MNNIDKKKILLIICGGISAYKSLEVIRLLKKKGAIVKTILTKSAKEFVTPLSVASLSQEKVYDDLFNTENESEMDHISLSRWSDLILVAPVTANTISKLSVGSSDDLASTVILASNKDIAIITLTSLSIKKSSGKNIGNITDDINNTVINGTPRQNSINPTEIYLTVGNWDLLPKAKNIPTGKQKIKQKKETIKVKDKPPHAPVSTHSSPNDPPDIK